jgi:hypothetical protein
MDLRRILESVVPEPERGRGSWLLGGWEIDDRERKQHGWEGEKRKKEKKKKKKTNTYFVRGVYIVFKIVCSVITAL